MRARIARWRRRHLPAGGRLRSPGHDHLRGHLEYVSRMDPWARRWLRTKPFSAPPIEELERCLHSFAHIVSRLELDFRAQVLDVGCGPGWLSEFLARCGYWVTGIDVSDDMIAIARERAAAIEGPVGEQLEPFAEFHVLSATELPWAGRFDAAVLYDTMHHFEDELETLSAIRRALVPGGKLYLHEGVRPEPGSESEQELIREMEEYGTLESPFDPDYLLAVVERAGFTDVTRWIEVDGLFDLADPSGALESVQARLAAPDTNTLIATNGAREEASAFRAELLLRGPAARRGDELVVPLTVTNTGSSYWPARPAVDGVVAFAPFLRGRDGTREGLRHVELPEGVPPGGAVEVDVAVQQSALGDARGLTIDLVRRRIAWFEELGSQPLEVELPAR